MILNLKDFSALLDIYKEENDSKTSKEIKNELMKEYITLTLDYEAEDQGETHTGFPMKNHLHEIYLELGKDKPHGWKKKFLNNAVRNEIARIYAADFNEAVEGGYLK